MVHGDVLVTVTVRELCLHYPLAVLGYRHAYCTPSPRNIFHGHLLTARGKQHPTLRDRRPACCITVNTAATWYMVRLHAPTRPATPVSPRLVP